MRLLLLISLVLVAAGCGTTISHTIEECDTTVNKIIGIPYDAHSDCTSTSNSSNTGDISDPRPEGKPQ